MIRNIVVTCLLAAAAMAQQATPQNAAISGVVKDIVTGRPLANYGVSTYVNATFTGDVLNSSPEMRQPSAVTDEQGRYRLSDLPPGDYRVTARAPQGFSSAVTRHISLAGRDIDSIDFAIAVAGNITGRIVDENREPMPGMVVWLVSREYYSGVLGYFFKNTARTDDRGIYTIQRVETGHPYIVMTESGNFRLPPRSDAPLDPKFRRRVPMRTYYPNTTDRQGASLIVLRPGETREGVDIEVKKTASFCVEGTASGLAGPASLSVMIEPAQPAYGTSSTGGMVGIGPGTNTGPDGKFRFCGLAPGSYRLAAADGFREPVNRALLPIEIVDRDLANANLTVGSGIPVNGEVVWDGAAPETPSTVKVNVTVNPLLRAPVANERGYARSDLPGPFTVPSLLPSDYAVRAFINGPGLYIKDLQYAGQSVKYGPTRIGSATGDAGLRVIVGRDGATVRAAVQDKDGNPLGDMRVLVLPADITSEAMLQAALVTGQTDQLGQYRSQALRPGKYYVLATQDRVNATPESIDNLWRSRNRFQEVTLPPGGSTQITLTPVSLK